MVLIKLRYFHAVIIRPGHHKFVVSYLSIGRILSKLQPKKEKAPDVPSASVTLQQLVHFPVAVPVSLNSSPIHAWNAFVFCSRPRKFFTRSFAETDPAGSSTVLRYFIGAAPTSGLV